MRLPISTLDLAAGRRLALIGESGSGKSTLAHAIAGLLPRERAKITGTIAFPSLGRAPRLGRDIGIVFQDPSGSLNPVLTVGEQIAEVVVVHAGSSWPRPRTTAPSIFSIACTSRTPASAARAIRTNSPAASGSASRSRPRSPPTRRS